MRAATYTQDKGFAVEDIPRPEPGPGDLLLRIRATAICGTDIKMVRNGHRKLRDGQRIVLGHELVGDIVATGAGVSGLKPGQRVGVAPNAGCGQCPACDRGEANYCETYTAFGIDRDGAHAPYMVVPAPFIEQGNVMPLPDTVSDAAAALLEPLSCVLNALQAVQLAAGERVVIYGAGPMGLLHVLACRDAGAGHIISIEPQIDRRRRALALGADLALDPTATDSAPQVKDATDGRGADVVITACPVAQVQQEAIGLLAAHGRVCLFGGLPRGSDPVPLDTNAIHYRHLTVTGTTGGSNAQYRAALERVAAGRIDPTVVIAETLDIQDMQRAYAVALNGVDGKVVMEAAG